MSIITLEDVTFSYPNGFTAVENLSLSFAAGESVALVGQNGAGKTSTAKLMNGLLRPSSGRVLVKDVDTASSTTAQVSRSVGYVFQNPDDQIFHNDVYGEIEFGPKTLGMTGSELEETVYAAAEIAGIAGDLDENPYNLPFSTRKFVAIASTIAMNCDAFILDEPTAGQDLAGMKTIARIMQSLQARGKTVITITHDMQFVVDNFERVVVMANKRVIADASARDVFWNDAVLEEAMLTQPHLSDLARSLGLPGSVLDLDEFTSAYLDTDREGTYA
ncbi:energy-coupling factor ABC transporter ATP-binding protein [Agromyces atrinae]|uniref:ABC transporter ATP-binding protein n=1 Tax=Agromyces atrinae TaxID=592376 RepID=A0A4Q2M345_9MICO|nr:ABC transporter ATP-binding protein [Agromyces atrinae]NYD66068.1 energy-coupling factor transport system ATP-binding protein [Agromyces atrinae]RXZ86394.1 ABC transporter ATP-binding protein [Agromyces atrinae]